MRARLTGSAGGALALDGHLRPTLGLRQGGLRGRALWYGLDEIEPQQRRLDPSALNAVDAERLDHLAIDRAFAAMDTADGETPPILFLPVVWSTVRNAKARRRLLRQVAAGQVDRRCVAVCEIVGLETGVPRGQVREAVGALTPIFRGVLARITPSPGLTLHLTDCGLSGVAIEADRLEDAADDGAMLRKVLNLQTIGPGVMVHSVRSIAALTAIRSAGASWASLDIQPGALEARQLLAETKTAARMSGPPLLVDTL